MAGRKGQRSGGHNAKTTAELQASGTYKPHRHAGRVDNVPTPGTPTMPEGLTKEQESLWSEVVDLLPDGCVGSLDNAALCSMLEWYGLYRTAMRKLKRDSLNKEARYAAKDAFDRFWRVAQDFGLSPVARARLQVEPGEPKPKREEPSGSDEPHAVLLKMRESG